MATPLDVVQPGVGDVPSPAPVDTTGSALAGPQPDDAALQQQALNGGQSMQANPTATAQPPKPGLWHSVLRGALAGLEMGGGVGAVIGAADPKMAIQAKQNREEMQAARTQFASLQAASQMLENSYRAHQINNMPQEMRMKVAESEAPLAEALLKNGISPVAISADDSDKSRAAMLRQLADTYPNGAPPLMQLHTASGQVMWFDPQQMGQNQDTLDQINMMRTALGQPPIASDQLNNKMVTPPPVKAKYITDSGTFFTPGGKSLDEVNQNLSKYKNMLALVEKLPSDNPYKSKTQEKLQNAVDLLNGIHDRMASEAKPPSLKAVSGTLNGQPAFGILTPKGWVDPTTHQPLQGFQPPKNYAQVAMDVANLRNETQTKEVLGPDGVHLKAFNPVTKNFDREQGFAGTGAQGNRGSAASASIRMGDELIRDIQTNGSKLGTLNAWVQKKGLNTPVADPDLARLQAELSSFAALQPVQHGFRSTDALTTFEKIIGGLQKNPKATIESIRALAQTARAINPASGAAPAAAAAAAPAQEVTATGPGGHKIAFRGGKWVDAQSGAPIQ